MGSSTAYLLKCSQRASEPVSPEKERRSALYKKARGDKKRLIGAWNSSWNRSGRPADFPSFEAFAQMTDRERITMEVNYKFARRH